MDPKRNWGSRKNHAPSPRVVGSARNEFGTRLCQRVVCTKCAGVDYVPVRVGSSKDVFCRSCAEKFLATYDQGRHIEKTKVSRVCEQCQQDFDIDEALSEKKEHLLCLDCLRGFDVWRGKMQSTSRIAKGQVILIKTGSKTTFRKKSDEPV